MPLFTKTGADVFAGTDQEGALRSPDNAEAQTWATEVEEALAAQELAEVTGTGLATGGGAVTDSPVIDVPIASEAEARAGTATDKAMTPQRVAQAIASLGSGIPTAVIEEQQVSGTNGGTFTSGAWQTRVLNTKVYDPATLVLLSANQFTPQKDGWVEWEAPGFNVGRHQTRLYNVTDAVAVGYGISTSNGATSLSSGGAPVVSGKTYRLEHRCTVTKTTNGLGEASAITGTTEIYSRLRFWRVP